MKPAVLNLFGVKLQRIFGKFESLLDERGQLADSAAFVAKNLLSVGGTDDDLGPGMGDAYFAARVSLLGQLAGEELIELGGEDTVGDKLINEGICGGSAQHSIFLQLYLSTLPLPIFLPSLSSELLRVSQKFGSIGAEQLPSDYEYSPSSSWRCSLLPFCMSKDGSLGSACC